MTNTSSKISKCDKSKRELFSRREKKVEMRIVHSYLIPSTDAAVCHITFFSYRGMNDAGGIRIRSYQRIVNKK